MIFSGIGPCSLKNGFGMGASCPGMDVRHVDSDDCHHTGTQYLCIIHQNRDRALPQQTRDIEPMLGQRRSRRWTCIETALFQCLDLLGQSIVMCAPPPCPYTDNYSSHPL